MLTHVNSSSADGDGVVEHILGKACPARQVLEVLGSKWTLLIIHALASGPTRTGALRRRIEGISEKMLSQTLKELESRNLVKRRAYQEVPPRVDYTLTPVGRSLCEIVKTLDGWAQEHGQFLTKDAPERTQHTTP